MRATLARLAVFAAVCVLGAGWLVTQLGNVRWFADARSYEVTLPDASGLLVDDAVRIAGIEVGKVTGLRLERGQAVATFTVDSDRRLGRDTTVGVRWRNLLGLRYLYVYPDGDGDLADGHRFPAERVVPPSDLSAFLARATPVMRALDPDVSNVVVQALAEALGGREEQVRTLVADAGAFLDALGERRDAVAGVLTDGAAVVDAYAARSDELRGLIARFAEVSDAVADRNDALVGAVEELAVLQEELHRTVATGEDDLRASLAALDTIAAVLATRHEEIEDLATSTSRGIVQYHRISRWGQWFNIRVVGLSVGEEVVTTERSATLPPARGKAAAGFFHGALPGGDR